MIVAYEGLPHLLRTIVLIVVCMVSARSGTAMAFNRWTEPRT